MIFGNLTGTAVILGWGFALIFREYVEIDRLVQACLDDGSVCFPDPSAFTRFAIYASIAMIEVFDLFTVSLTVERWSAGARLRSRVAPLIAAHAVVGRSTRFRTIHFNTRSAASLAALLPLPGPIPLMSV